MSQATASDEKCRTGPRPARSAAAVHTRPLAQALRPAPAGRAEAVKAWITAGRDDALPAWQAMYATLYPAPGREGGPVRDDGPEAAQVVAWLESPAASTWRSTRMRPIAGIGRRTGDGGVPIAHLLPAPGPGDMAGKRWVVTGPLNPADDPCGAPPLRIPAAG